MKFRKSISLKIIASVLLSISIVTGFISGLLVLGGLYDDYYMEGGKENFREDIIENICWDYNETAYNWYGSLDFDNLEKENADTERYREHFAEENSNYFFVIEPIDEEDKKVYPTLSNYTCEDYQYKGVTTYSIAHESGEDTFMYEVDFGELTGEIYSYYDDTYFEYEEYEEYEPTTSEPFYDDVTTEIAGYEENTEAPSDGYDVTESYDDVREVVEAGGKKYTIDLDEEYIVDYYAYEEDYGDDEAVYLVIVYEDFEIRYNLIENKNFNYAYYNFRNDMEEVYDYISLEYIDFNLMNNRLTIDFNGIEYIELKQTYYVKSELTANDEFKTSVALKYYGTILDVAPLVLVLSAVFALVAFIYIIVAAGHVKGQEEIYLNWFHRMPLDIVAIGFFLLVCLGIYGLDEMSMYYSYKRTIFYACFMIPAVGFLPIMISTIAARGKCGNILKNTITYKVCRFIFTKIRDIFNYVRVNANLYIKWIGIYVVISIVELFLALASYSYGFVIILWCVEKIIITIILAIAIINMNKLKKGAQEIADGKLDYEIETDKMFWEFKKHGENLNRIRDGIQVAVEDRMKSERMKTELITNVSHDIKTPLTSLINYVDLLSKEELNNEKADDYIEVLERQSAKLKKLIQDLIDASKASSGNLEVEIADVDVKVLVEQSLGEFADKLSARSLTPIVNFRTENTTVKADGRHLWRVIDNLINNISKYAQEGTRVYIDVERVGGNEQQIGINQTVEGKTDVIAKKGEMLKLTFKNISGQELNISGSDLMERFVRGDKSRNTEGSGLGLSIAQSLMKLQNGDMEIIIDGDLFKVELYLQ